MVEEANDKKVQQARQALIILMNGVMDKETVTLEQMLPVYRRMEEIANIMPNQRQAILPVGRDDVEYLGSLRIGEMLESSMSMEEFGQVLNIALLIVPELETVNQVSPEILKLSPQMKKYIKRIELNKMHGRLLQLEKKTKEVEEKINQNFKRQSQALIANAREVDEARK